MADLTTAQKAKLITTTADGGWVDPAARTYTLSADAPFHIHPVANDHPYVVADAPGSGTIDVTANGQTGSITVTITAAPLTVILGPAEPK